MPQRVGSPFRFGQAVLEPHRQPLWATCHLPRRHIRHGQVFNFFRETPSKTYTQTHYAEVGGSLRAPRLAVVQGVWAGIQPLNPLGDWEAGARTTWQRIRMASTVRFQVGVRDYLEVPMHLMPVKIHQRKIAIPSQQMFFVQVTFDQEIDMLGIPYSMTVALDAEVGVEVR